MHLWEDMILLRGQKLNCILMGNNKGYILQFLVILA